MDYTRYREMLESKDDLNSAERQELLKLYLQTPSLPKLQAARTLLFELKTKLDRCANSKKKGQKIIRHMLCKKRSA